MQMKAKHRIIRRPSKTGPFQVVEPNKDFDCSKDEAAFYIEAGAATPVAETKAAKKAKGKPEPEPEPDEILE